jgi:GDP/UDP-N,N'-diacetylbacillosamine 2-epimerase (hydrolysing)
MIKKNIAIFTSTRSDISILSPLIEKLQNSKLLNYFLFVHGTHLNKKYGSTISEIKKLKFKIAKSFNDSSEKDDQFGQILNLNKTQFEVNKIFKNFKIDAVIILGDRLERLPILTACIVYRKVIIHLHGGEITLGAIDEQIRHMISKAAHLHFVIAETYKKNLLKMRERSNRIFNFGSLGVEKSLKLRKKNIKKENIPILTFHPETIFENFAWEEKFALILKALDKFNYNIIITAPGFEKNSKKFITTIKKILKNKDPNKFKFTESLGFKNYFSMLNKSKFVIGNSSSGIIEVPYFKIPTINIGDRQEGRYMHQSIIPCDYKFENIVNAIKKCESKKFINKIQTMKLSFGNGNTSSKIVKVLEKKLLNEKSLIKKI